MKSPYFERFWRKRTDEKEDEMVENTLGGYFITLYKDNFGNLEYVQQEFVAFNKVIEDDYKHAKVLKRNKRHGKK